MNDDDKKPNVNAGDLPDLASEDNPWDDEDGGGRTLATEGPSFEIPSNIPSPITVPPPAPPAPPPMAAPAMPNLPPKRKAQATMIGFGPPGPALPNEPPPATQVPETPRAPQPPLTAPGSTPRSGPVVQTSPAFPPVSKPGAPAQPPVGKPMPPQPLGGSTLQASPAPPSSPDLSAAAAAAGVTGGGPPSSAKRAPPPPPRPAGAGGAPSPPRPGAGAVPPSARKMPVPLPTAAAAAAAAVPPPAPSQPDQQEDSPTMAVSSPLTASRGSSPDRPLRDDVANPRPMPPPMASAADDASQGMAHLVDKDADTMALDGSPRDDDDRLPSLNASEGESEEATRAVSRDELMRSRDASIVVGEDAMGDEATLAVAAGHVDGLDPSLSAALVEQLKEREASQPHLQAAPFGGEPGGSSPFGADPGFPSSQIPSTPQPLGMGMQPVVPQWGEAAGYRPPPPQAMPQGFDPGFDPMLPQQAAPYGGQGHLHGHFPQSGQQPIGQPMPPMGMHGGPGPGAYGQHPNAMGGGGPQPHGMHGMQGHPNPQAGWIAQPSPPAGMQRPSKFTPQVILLVAVGAVCLAIFVIGIVLFVTTKF